VTTITFKVTEDEARQIRARARKEGLTVSEFLRLRARATLPTARKPRKVRCPRTGAMIFSGPSDRPPITTESVRQILADFP
jgi:hypothetical protein